MKKIRFITALLIIALVPALVSGCAITDKIDAKVYEDISNAESLTLTRSGGKYEAAAKTTVDGNITETTTATLSSRWEVEMDPYTPGFTVWETENGYAIKASALDTELYPPETYAAAQISEPADIEPATESDPGYSGEETYIEDGGSVDLTSGEDYTSEDYTETEPYTESYEIGIEQEDGNNPLAGLAIPENISMPLAIMIVTVMLALSFLMLISFWVIFEKAGIAGWKVLIPVYSTYLLWKIATGNGWLFLLMLIPVVGELTIFYLYWKLNEAYGGGIPSYILMIILPFFVFPVMAFDGTFYTGPLATEG